jgi:archaellum biogenesis protein FlaJ (TadC family)
LAKSIAKITVEEAARRRNRRREVLAAIIAVVAIVLIWRAIWDMAAGVMAQLTSLVTGLGLIGVVAYHNKDYLRELF